jgi:hypothetical protein
MEELIERCAGIGRPSAFNVAPKAGDGLQRRQVEFPRGHPGTWRGAMDPADRGVTFDGISDGHDHIGTGGGETTVQTEPKPVAGARHDGKFPVRSGTSMFGLVRVMMTPLRRLLSCTGGVTPSPG